MFQTFFVFPGQNFFSQSGKVSVSKGQHVKTFENYGPEFHVELTVRVLKDADISGNGYGNILHVNDGGPECCAHGNRFPAIFYNDDRYFEFISTINGDGHARLQYNGVKLNFDYKIIVSQQYNTAGKLIYTITVNEQVLYFVENTNPLTINNGLLYLSNHLSNSFGPYGQVSDVTVISGHIKEGNQLFFNDKI